MLDRAGEVGARDLLLASAVPRYIWPGVDTSNTRAGMLLETLGFERDWVGTNMAIDTSFRRPPPPGFVVEMETGSGAHDFAAAAYPHWVPELDRSVDLGTAVAARDADGRTIGFVCHSVNRAGWIGPMATDPTVQHSGVGSAVLAGAVRRSRTARRARPARSRGSATCASTASAERRVSRVFLGGRLNSEAAGSRSATA